MKNKKSKKGSKKSNHAPNKPHAPSVTPAPTGYGDIDSFTAGYANRDHVPLRKLMSRLNRDRYYNMAVRSSVAYTTGAGYHLTPSIDESGGSRALELIEHFADDQDLDALLIRIATDIWATGNAFLVFDHATESFIPIDQGTIINIETDDFDRPVTYWRQSNSGHVDKMPPYSDTTPDGLIHMAFQAQGPWGVGIGQVMERRGLGWKDSRGKYQHAPSDFESREMLDHVNALLIYGGLARFLVNIDAGQDETNATMGAMSKLDALQHVVTNRKTDIKTIGLSPSRGTAELYNRIDQHAIVGTMNPLPKLWAANEFSYASSKSALSALYPIIDIAQRALKRFIEQKIFRPLLEAHGYDWHEHKVSIAFGSEQILSIDLVKDAAAILENPEYAGKYDPADIVEMLRDLGLPLTAPGNDPDAMMHAKARQKRMHARHTTVDHGTGTGTTGGNADAHEYNRMIKRINRKGQELSKSKPKNGLYEATVGGSGK